MSRPRVATVKRLFALSGNQCAFPNCQVELVDRSAGKVTGKICHIKGESVNGPRYDPNQTDEERQRFDNLLLMCSIRHDVIDSDIESYTVERLRSIKAKHEVLYAEGKDPSDDIADQLLSNMDQITVLHGSLIFSKNQMGGQVAHSIVNVGKQPRSVFQAAASALISELRKYPSERVDVVAVMGDAESFGLAQLIEEILKHAGWQSNGVSQAVFSGLPKDVIIETSVDKPSLGLLLNWLGQLGFKPQGFLKHDAAITKIIVGSSS